MESASAVTIYYQNTCCEITIIIVYKFTINSRLSARTSIRTACVDVETKHVGHAHNAEGERLLSPDKICI